MEPITISDLPASDAATFMAEFPRLDLPPGCTPNEDGSVTMELYYPRSITLRETGTGRIVRDEQFTSLTLRRLNGADTRKVFAASSKNVFTTALALSSGLGPARLNMLQNVMDARDEGAANAVVAEFLGGMNAGLPPNAEETPDGVLLKLYQPAADDDGTMHAELLFKPLTAAQRRQAADAPSLLDWGVGRCDGLTPKLAKTVVDNLDGADAWGANPDHGFFVRDWQPDFPVTLGAIGGHFSFTKAELDALTVREMNFWVGCMNGWVQRVKAARK